MPDQSVTSTPNSLFGKLCGSVLKLSGWQIETRVPAARQYVLIAYPHTSNWDFVIMLLINFHLGLRLSWVGKNEMFRWPFGAIWKRLGGVPVDRRQRTGFVEAVADLYSKIPDLKLIIAPEGTRSYRDAIKSGFYHIARTAGVPVVLGFMDYQKKYAGLGPELQLSDDIQADLAKMQDFYSGQQPRFPKQASKLIFKPRKTTTSE